MKAHIDSLISSLTESRDALADIEDLNARKAAAQAELDATTKTLARTKAELESQQAGLNEAQIQNRKNYDRQIFEKNKQLEDVTRRLGIVTTQLETKAAELNSAEERHRQIEDSINALRSRLG